MRKTNPIDAVFGLLKQCIDQPATSREKELARDAYNIDASLSARNLPTDTKNKQGDFALGLLLVMKKSLPKTCKKHRIDFSLARTACQQTNHRSHNLGK
jgi:hypothetical protein